MITIKRGDTFAFYADLKDETGAALVTSVSNLKCQIRDPYGTLFDTMAITTTETSGRYLFTAGPTTAWPIGTLQFDIKINVGGKISTSPTQDIQVAKEVTAIV